MESEISRIREIAAALKWCDGLADEDIPRRILSFVAWVQGAALTLEAIADNLEEMEQ